MKLPVAILHGWSDSADSFVPLSDFLKANGFYPRTATQELYMRVVAKEPL